MQPAKIGPQQEQQINNFEVKLREEGIYAESEIAQAMCFFIILCDTLPFTSPHEMRSYFNKWIIFKASTMLKAVAEDKGFNYNDAMFEAQCETVLTSLMPRFVKEEITREQFLELSQTAIEDAVGTGTDRIFRNTVHALRNALDATNGLSLAQKEEIMKIFPEHMKQKLFGSNPILLGQS